MVATLKGQYKRLATSYFRHVVATRSVQKDKVVFESFQGREISCSPFAMMRELEGDPAYRIYAVTNRRAREKNRRFLEKNGIHAKLVLRHSPQYVSLLATAGYVIGNTSLPAYYTRREGQTYLQTWHGTPLKALGKRMRGGLEAVPNVRRNFLESSHLLFPNEYTMRHIMEDYELEGQYTGKVLLAGYPRNAAFFAGQKTRDALRKNLGLDGETVYAYLPTWRGSSSISDVRGNDIIELLGKLDEALEDDEWMYVGFHSILKETPDLSAYRHIRPIPEDVPRYDFLNMSDALITDYSSVMFDYSLTGKPIVLFAQDEEAYADERGMYITPEELPFRLCYDTETLCELLRTKEVFKCRYDTAEEYRNTFLPYDSADAAVNMCDYVFRGKCHDIKEMGRCHQ